MTFGRWNLVVRADTVLLALAEMEVDPIRLDSLLVRDAGTFTLRGEILDALTGRRIAEARVLADSRFEALTDWRGTFRIARLPRGFTAPILVDAFKYV